MLLGGMSLLLEIHELGMFFQALHGFHCSIFVLSLGRRGAADFLWIMIVWEPV